MLIADEVLVWMGRTGAWWGLTHWQVVPDIKVKSKGLAGGYFPFGFVATGLENVERIRQKLGDFNHGGTFSHHTVGAAAGLATLNIIHNENLIANSAEMGTYLGQKLYHTFSEHPHIGDIRGKGLFGGLEFVQDRATKTPYPATDKLHDRIRQRAFDNGLMVYYSQGCADGGNGDIIMLGPPLIVTREQVDEMVELLAAAIHAELGK